MAKRYKFDKEDGKSALKVLVYSMLSAGVAALIMILGEFDFPKEYLFLVPVVNTALVSLKDFFENRLEKAEA